MTETVELKPCPMDTAPKDGSMLRLFCRFDGDSSTGAFEDADEGWTIGTNNLANTGEDVWDIVGWDWMQDTFRQAHTAQPLGWLPFHAVSGPAVRDGVTDEMVEAAYQAFMHNKRPGFMEALRAAITAAQVGKT